MAETRADVVVVGGGAAGAVMAARLSEDPARAVLLLEGGPVYPLAAEPRDLRDPGHVPGEPEHDWGYTGRGSRSAPEIFVPRGKALGGSSAVNAAIAMRPRDQDIQEWQSHGVEGGQRRRSSRSSRRWSAQSARTAAITGAPAPSRSTRNVMRSSALRSKHSWIRASRSAFPTFLGSLDGGAEGWVPLRSTSLTACVNTRGGSTWTTAFADDRTCRSTATWWWTGFVWTAGERRGCSRPTARSSAPRMSSCQPVHTEPQPSCFAGDRPAAELRDHGIEVIADLPVGQHLHDHPFFYNPYALARDALDMAPRAGALLWIASSEAADGELDLHITATHLMDPSLSPTGGAIVLATAVVRPESRGTIRLRSRNPSDPPIIDCNFLDTPRDRSRMLEGVKLSRSIGRHSAFAPLIAAELAPGEGVQDDGELAQFIESNINTYGHATATAPMGGPNDPWGVVDSHGAVNGIVGLRVVDASIIPAAPSVATNLTTIMIAGRIAHTVY